MKNLFFFIFLSFFLYSCASKNSPITIENNLTQKEFSEFNASRLWWKNYQNEKLNQMLDFVILNNKDINVARANLLSAVARYKLIDFDLYPTLSANLGANIARDLNLGSESKSFSNALNLSYELDIYGKISDSVKAKEFSAKASEYDLENLKLSIVNQSINYLFELLYFNDVEKLLNEYILNLEQMKSIYEFKLKYGKIEELDLLNIEQNLLSAKQNLLSNQQNKELIIKNLQELIGKEQGFTYISYFQNLSLSDFKELAIDFDIPLYIFANRPDVKSKANNLQAAFKDYQSIEKSIFPSISLGANLNGDASELNDSFEFLILGGNVKISLPFLDYGRVKQNIKISQYAYDILVFEYEQILQSALNEFRLCYKDYEYNTKLLENVKLINAKQFLIKEAYLQKYELGKSELKDYLDASNSYITSAQEILRSRVNLLKTINQYFQITTILP
ncbi:TolC family protein [Campylobacter sp. CCS1377]|uniref:TolC family protein n=1 Tax=Campylobacter sp. CCS1377 TaxID=3158229 RepID=A0AAU7E4T8_9BACT